jgi:hypothetical protein
VGEHRGQGIAIKERHLRGAEHCHSSLSRVPLGEYAARLHRQCGIALHLETLAPDVRSIAKCRVGVAADGSERHREIGAALLEQQDVMLPRNPAIHDRRQFFNDQRDRPDPVLGQRRPVR